MLYSRSHKGFRGVLGRSRNVLGVSVAFHGDSGGFRAYKEIMRFPGSLPVLQRIEGSISALRGFQGIKVVTVR